MTNTLKKSFIKTLSDSILQQSSKIEVHYKKISDVKKESQIKLDEDTFFEFSCTASKDKDELCLELSEIGALCPFIYQKKLSLDDMISKHKAFRTCNDVQEVKEHIDRLFNQKGKIKLSKNNNEDNKSVILTLKVSLFAKEDDIFIELNQLMTTEKNETLEELYKIEKNSDKVFKNLKKYMEDNGLRDALKKFNDLLKENLV